MPIETTTQDSRDPNSPQWGYVKVRDPETQLQYPAKDDQWNEYVMFVHDPKFSNISLEKGKIERRTNVKAVMVPARLTISVDLCKSRLEVLERELQSLRSSSIDVGKDASKISELEYERGVLTRVIENGVNIEIPTKDKEAPDNTTLWVALVEALL